VVAAAVPAAAVAGAIVEAAAIAVRIEKVA
jgi:hypothetical protein